VVRFNLSKLNELEVRKLSTVYALQDGGHDGGEGKVIGDRNISVTRRGEGGIVGRS
jgi:hypothetical protein